MNAIKEIKAKTIDAGLLLLAPKIKSETLTPKRIRLKTNAR